MSAITYTNGAIAAQKGKSFAFDALDTFASSDDTDAHSHWVIESLFDLAALPRLDSAIPAYAKVMLPVLARGIAAEDIEVTGVTLYRHPDGAGRLDFDADTSRLYLVNDEIDVASFALIGPWGLRELGAKLLALAAELEGATHEHS